MTGDNQTPFREKNMHCPSCGKSSSVVYLPGETSRIYVPEHHEPDKHVTSWKWKNPLWADINPYHYSLLFCSNCYYADFPEDFKHDHSNPRNKITYIKPMMLNDKDKDNSVINFLGKDIDFHNMTVVMAVKTFLLAIYIQELIQDLKKDEEYHQTRDWNKLARLYLRLAWIYREMGSDSGDDSESKKFAAVDTSLEELRTAVSTLKNKLNTCKELVTGTFKDANAPILEKIFTAETQTMENLEKLSLTLNSTVVKIKTDLGETPTENKDEQELKDLMINLSALWPEAVFSEEKAMRRAIYFYSMTADNDPYLSPQAAFNTAEFTATLWSMIGKENDALLVLQELVRRASNERTKITRKLNTKKSMVDKMQIEDEMKKMNAYIQEISYKYKELKAKLEKEG